MRLDFQRLVLGGNPTLSGPAAETAAAQVQLAKPPRPAIGPVPTASPGLDERVVLLVVSVAIVASAGFLAASQGLAATVSAEPLRVATLLALTLVLQMFSVQVYGRGSVSVSAVGILASAFLFDTGTTMAIAVLAAITQSIRNRSELYKGLFDAANFALSAGTASLIFLLASDWRLVAALLAGGAFAVVNNGLLCLAMSFAERASWTTIWFERFHWARFHF